MKRAPWICITILGLLLFPVLATADVNETPQFSDDEIYDDVTELKDELASDENVPISKFENVDYSVFANLSSSPEEAEFWNSLYHNGDEEEEIKHVSTWEDELRRERETEGGNSTRRQLASCDYSRGNWVYDQSRRPYTYGCKWIRTAFNCRANGRRNVKYEKYSWNPSGCSQERFSIRYFLPRMRGKTIALIGDSFSQNFAQSLYCQLFAWTHVRIKAARINGVSLRGVEVPAFGIKIFLIPSPFLVASSSDPAVFGRYKIKYGATNSYVVWLDEMDAKWKNALLGFDLPIFMSGHWYQLVQGITAVRSVTLIENEKIVNYSGQQGYGIAIRNLKRYVAKTAGHRGVPMWLTYSPSHYNVAVINGVRTAVCQQTVPYTSPQQRAYFQKDSSRVWRRIELDSLAGSRFRILDITFLSGGRPDAHVQRYFGSQKNSKTTWDCTHWCLPGLPDIWTDVLQHTLKNL